MEAILNQLVNNWDLFSIWVTNQPTFVEVAFGVGLFYVALQIVRTIYQVIRFLLSGLFSVPRRFQKQKDMRVKPAGRNQLRRTRKPRRLFSDKTSHRPIQSGHGAKQQELAITMRYNICKILWLLPA